MIERAIEVTESLPFGAVLLCEMERSRSFSTSRGCRLRNRKGRRPGIGEVRKNKMVAWAGSSKKNWNVDV